MFRDNNAPVSPAICPMPMLTRQLIELEDLLKEKYLKIDVKVTFGNNQVKVTLLNGRNGIHEGIDQENEGPIAFLKSLGAKETREEAEHQYWSNSIITLDRSKLKDAIEGLKALPTPSHEGTQGKRMARC